MEYFQPLSQLTNTARQDHAEFARAVVAFLSAPIGATLLRTAAVSIGNDTLAAMRAEFWRTHYELASTIIKRGIDRGELPDEADSPLAAGPSHGEGSGSCCHTARPGGVRAFFPSLLIV